MISLTKEYVYWGVKKLRQNIGMKLIEGAWILSDLPSTKFPTKAGNNLIKVIF